jgi:hypothetical protein
LLTQSIKTHVPVSGLANQKPGVETSELLLMAPMNKLSPDQMHADPANWKWGIFYFCRQDPRIIVPKRIRGLGWTINFARPAALLCLAVMILFVYGTLALARLAGASHDTQLMIKVLLALGIMASAIAWPIRPGKVDTPFWNRTASRRI